MRIHGIEFEEIVVAANRQRRQFSPEALIELASSITQCGLIHPIVVRRDAEDNIVLVAGERRIKAMQYVWNFGEGVKCGDQEFPENIVPCIFLGEIDSIDAFEIELEENIRRIDLTWQEKAKATADLFALRKRQADRAGAPQPSVAEFTKEVAGSESLPIASQTVRDNILVAKHLDNPVVAKARSSEEALKILRREEELAKSAELAREVGKTHSRASHVLLQGECIQLMSTFPYESFDVILTDPPYGMGADTFGDSGGKAQGAHFYDDSFSAWLKLMAGFLPQAFKISKPQAHLYIFCDIDRFHELRANVIMNGWKAFRTPLIWHNPTSNRAPWPEHGPHRKYQTILYAMKGDRPVTRLFPDVIEAPSDENLNHHAQKPVALFTNLLLRSIRPGDSVLDPFCGSGPIFPAAHNLKCRATGIEQNPAAAGIAAKRLEGLK